MITEGETSVLGGRKCDVCGAAAMYPWVKGDVQGTEIIKATAAVLGHLWQFLLVVFNTVYL